MNVTIYHNPNCTKSRLSLQLLKEKNLDIKIIEYLKTPPNTQELDHILNLLNLQPRELIRRKEAEYSALNLTNSELTRDDLILAMVNNPKLIERPIILANNKATIGRPPENILAIL